MKINVIKDYMGNESISRQWEVNDFVNKMSTVHAMLALKINNNKQFGHYIEIGAGHFKENNNTYFLEKNYKWHGVALDISKYHADIYNKNRSNPCLNEDAIFFDWEFFLSKNEYPKIIDFLQIDIDWHPNKHGNFLALINLPLTKYRFNVISIEHGSGLFYELKKIANLQREILSSLGYYQIYQGINDDIWINEQPNTKNGYSSITAMSTQGLLPI